MCAYCSWTHAPQAGRCSTTSGVSTRQIPVFISNIDISHRIFRWTKKLYYLVRFPLVYLICIHHAVPSAYKPFVGMPHATHRKLERKHRKRSSDSSTTQHPRNELCNGLHIQCNEKLN